MRIKKSVLSSSATLMVAAATVSWSGLIHAQGDEAQEKAAEVVNQASEAGNKTFEEALDEAEETASSLLSDTEESPYLFEYEYEYDYDSNFTGFRRPSSTGGAATAEATEGTEDQQDRIEEAQQKLAEAQQFAPKSRVREQFVQLGGESISTIGLTGFADLVGTGARGILVQPTEFSASSLDISLRGVGGTTVDQATGESGVGVFLDGVPVLRGQAYSLGLMDLESMDLLRGSRGVIAGRNAVGGAVYMKSRKPSGEFGFRQRIRFGLAYDDTQAITNIDLPRMASMPVARISYLTSNAEGRVENVGGVSANDFGESDNEAFRIALSSVPSDNLSIDWTFERSDLESTPLYYQALTASASESPFVESDYQDKARASIPLPLSKTDQTLASMIVSYVVNENLEFKPTFGWSELNDSSFVNFDGRMNDLNGNRPDAEFFEGTGSREEFENRVFYYDLQANGRLFGSLLNYSIGLSGIDDKSDIEGTIASGEANLDSTSVYLQTVWSLSERLKLTAGVRDTEDEKDFTRTSFDSGFGLADNIERNSFIKDSYTDYALAVDFDLSKTLKVYASYATAHKAGGTSLYGQTELVGVQQLMRVYGAEEALTYQVGAKGSLFDSKLYFDIAAFSTDIEDRQLVFRDPDNRRLTDIVNATDIASVRGAELDLRYNLNDSVRLSAFITYTDTDSNEPNGVYRSVNPLEFQFDPDSATESVGVAHVEGAPEYTYTLTADFKFGVGQSRDSVFRIEYVGIDDYHYDMFTEFTDSRSILNARLLFSGFELEGADDGKIQISVWGENLTDEEYIINAADVTSFSSSGTPENFTSGAYGTPLTFGMDIDYVF